MTPFVLPPHFFFLNKPDEAALPVLKVLAAYFIYFFCPFCQHERVAYPPYPTGLFRCPINPIITVASSSVRSAKVLTSVPGYSPVSGFL